MHSRGEKEDYIKCLLMVDGFLDIKSIFLSLYSIFLAVHYTHINAHFVLLLLLTVPCILCSPKYLNILYHVAIADCTHIGSATGSFD